MSRDGFEAYRDRLLGAAYRMLGSRADAEDVVQEAYVRWHQADRDEIRNPEAWLVTTVTRLAIDRHRRGADPGGLRGREPRRAAR